MVKGYDRLELCCLEKLFGEGVTNKIKGCEFHYKDSVNKKARSLGEDDEEFKLIAINLLESSTPEAYEKIKWLNLSTRKTT